MSEVKDNIKVSPTANVETPVASKAVKTVSKDGPFIGNELIPWMWMIKRGINRQSPNLLSHEDETQIEAENASTGRVFKGTTAEFNEKMSG